ncbi:MAG: Ig-like domain-containing protein [Candidatus Ozemobacteraceae bacterium]
MKRASWLVSVLLVLVLAADQYGCRMNPFLKDESGFSSIAQEPEGRAAVRFHLTIPDIQPHADVEPSILSLTQSSPQVSIRILLVSPGNTQQPFNKLEKIVVASSKGTVDATFAGLPLQPVVAQVKIENGHVSGWTDFHGAADLQIGDNLVELVPVGSRLSQDLVANVIESIVQIPEAMANVPLQIVSTIQTSIAGIDLKSSSAYSQALDCFLSRIPQTNVTMLSFKPDGKTLVGSQNNQPIWQKTGTTLWIGVDLWGTDASQLTGRAIWRQGLGGFGYVAWQHLSRKTFGVARVAAEDGSRKGYCRNDGSCEQAVCLNDGSIIIGGNNDAKGCPVLFRWNGTASASTFSSTGSAEGLSWVRYFDTFAKTSEIPFPTISSLQYDGVNTLWASIYDPVGQATRTFRIDPGTGLGETTMPTTSSSSNKLPFVSLASPTAGTRFPSAETITLLAEAIDSDGTVTKVEFFQGGTRLGESVKSPFQFAWENPEVGTYSLSAKVTDNHGAIGVSASVSVVVFCAPLRVRSFYPPDDTVGLGASLTLSIAFNRPPVAGTGTIYLKTSEGNMIFEAIPISDPRVSIVGNKVTIQPSKPFANQTGYSVSIAGSCFRDTDGNDFTGIIQLEQWNFSTGDFVSPSVTLTTSASQPTKISPIPVTVTFSEPVTGFTLDDVAVVNGVPGDLQTVTASQVFSLTVTPDRVGTITVDVASAAATDAAGNGNTAAERLTRTFNNVRPTVTLSAEASDTIRISSFPVTITFSADVIGFALGDVSVNNGVPGNLQTVIANRVFTIDVTPTGNGLITVDIASDVVRDAIGNFNAAAPRLNRTFDTVVPTVVISSIASSATRISPIPITITFSEEVFGFVIGDLTVVGGTPGNLQNATPGRTFTADITPDGVGTVSVGLAAGVVKDAAGNGNQEAAQFTRIYDDQCPTLISCSVASPTENTVRLIFVTSENALCRLEYGTNTGYGQQIVMEKDYQVNHSVDIFGLSASTTYHFRVHSQDVAGNATPSSDFTFSTQELMYFPDAGLDEVVRSTISKPTGFIFRSDVDALLTLEAGSKGISDLSGLESCRNLKTLNLTNNQISSLTPLASLTALEDLRLESNHIADVSPLRNLVNLTSLVIHDNQIVDNSSLGNLTKLKNFDIGSNMGLSNIAVVANFPDLEEINVEYTNVSDIQPFAGLTKLKKLNLVHTLTSNITVLSNLVNLESVDFRSIFVDLDLSSMRDLKKLSNINIDAVPITNITPLCENTNLKTGCTIVMTRSQLNSYFHQQQVQSLRDRGVVASFSSNLAPNSEFVPVTPDLLDSVVATVTIGFSKPVVNVDITDLALTRNAAPVDISGCPLTAVHDFEYFLDLSSVSDVAGSYTLTLSPSNIQDSASRGLTNTATVLWMNTLVPTIIGVTSEMPDGSYKSGTQIDINVRFSKPVKFSIAPQLTLETGIVDRVISCTGGNNTATLTFPYTVQVGDTSGDLNYKTKTSLSGTITDASGNPANLTLADYGRSGSLSANKNLVIDTATPSLASLNPFSPADGETGVQTDKEPTITFSENIFKGASGKVYLRKTLDDSLVEEFLISSPQLSISNHLFRIIPSTPLASNTSYYILVESTCINDAAGNVFPGISDKTSWNFVTTVDKTITAFNFYGFAPFILGQIDHSAKTIAIEVPWGTSLAHLVPTIMHTGASISPDSGVAQTFSDGVPLTYTVMASDTSTLAYQVTVRVAPNVSPDYAYMDILQNKLYQVSPAMEFSQDNEASYSACLSSVASTTFEAGDMVWVRLAADHSRKKFLGMVESVSGKADLDMAKDSFTYISENNGLPGDTKILCYGFSNIGDSSCTNFKIKFYLSRDRVITASDTLIATMTFVYSTNPGKIPPSSYFSTNCTIPDFEPGNYYVGAIIDSGNDISELNENNNVTPPDKVSSFIIKDPTPPADGAFKFVNSWGEGGWETIADGHYWVTYKTIKKQEMDVFYCYNQADQAYQPRVIAVFQLTHPSRRECKVIAGLGDPTNPFRQKEFQLSVWSTGAQPFPGNKMVMDISEFGPYINDFDIFLSVVNSQGTAGTVDFLSVEFYTDYASAPFKTIEGGVGAFAGSVSTNFTASTTGSLTSGELGAISPLPRATAPGTQWIEDKPTGDDLKIDMERIGVFKPGVNYNQIIDGKYGTGLVPPTLEQWGQLKKLRSFSSGARMAVLPDSVDHSKSIYFPPIGSQGGEGSCACFSFAYYIHTFQMARENNWDLSATTWTSPDPSGLSNGGAPTSNLDKIFSPDFIYHQINSGGDNGSWYGNASDLLGRLGCATWNTMPYDTTDHTSWPSEAAWREACKYRQKDSEKGSGYGYFTVRTDSDIQLLKSLLSGGYCVSVGIRASDLYYLRDANDVIDNDIALPMATNHAQTIVGYKEGAAWDKNSPDL